MGFHLEEARRYLLELAPLDEEGRELGRRAAGHLAPAGRRAFGRGDMAAAANLLRRSADRRPEHARERVELLPELGEALAEIGEFAEAQARLDEAVAAAAVLEDPTLEADAILTRLLVAHHTLEELDGWRSEVQREADRLIPLLEHDDAAGVRAKAWRMVAFVHGVVCQWQETADALERAIAAAKLADDQRMIARLSSSYVMALTEGPTPAPVAIERADEVLAYGLVDRQAEAVAMLTTAPLHAMSGDFERARELAGRARELLLELGAATIAARTSVASSQIELMAGDPESAERKIRADFEALTAMDERFVRPYIAALLAKVLVELGRHDEADDVVSVAVQIASEDDVEAQVVMRSVHARILAARGQSTEARIVAQGVLELARGTDSPVLHADTLVDLAELFDDSPTERSAVLEQALALYEQKRHLVGMARVNAALVKSLALP
jgi:tetratricopeptide (TPR) repeat protein